MPGDVGTLLLPLVLLLLVGFMFWSQRRRQRSAQALQSSIGVGDDVCTTSGLFGRVVAMDDLLMHLEVAPGTVVRFDRRAVATKVEPGGSTPASPTTTDAGPASPVDEK
ncbi:MAG: preprotein translocase subunit YajC [Lapillicoccus sp.]